MDMTNKQEFAFKNENLPQFFRHVQHITTKTVISSAKNCNVFVCFFCVGSKTTHKEHEFLELVDVHKKQRINIVKDMEEFENLLYPTYKKSLRELKTQINTWFEGYEKLAKEMSTQEEEWNKAIDMVITEMKTKIIEIRVKY